MATGSTLVSLKLIVGTCGLLTIVFTGGFTRQSQLEDTIVGTHFVLGEIRLSPEIREACRTFLVVAAAAQLPSGCEESVDSDDRSQISEVRVLSGSTVAEALAEMRRAFPAYETRIMDEVIVTRPVTSWRAAGHYLHRRYDPAEFGGEGGVLEVIQTVERLWTGRERPWPDDLHMRERRVSVKFRGGSGLELLNEIARSGQLLWRIGHNEVQGIPDAVYLELMTFEGRGIGASLPRRPPARNTPIDRD